MSLTTDRNLALEAVCVTEAAARAADQAAVEAMHTALDMLAIDGTIRIGEGRDSRLLRVGGKAGSGEGPKVDIALMALEGSTIIAKGEPNGLSVLAMAANGGFLEVPDIYMDKIAVGGGLPAGVVDLDQEPGANLEGLARAKGVEIGEIVACILDRPRHSKLIAKVRQAGARINLIRDGDVSGVIATAWPESGIDIYMGTGGVTLAATGITSGNVLDGVRRVHGVYLTHSIVMRSKSGTVRYIEGYHKFGADA